MEEEPHRWIQTVETVSSVLDTQSQTEPPNPDTRHRAVPPNLDPLPSET